MAKTLLKTWPDESRMVSDFTRIYPEVDPYALLTHVWMRRMSAFIDDAVDEFLAPYKISAGRFIILLFLEFAEEGLKPSELATGINVTQATITGLIDGLENDGYVKRKEHHRDGRACVVVLTERGRKFIATTRPEFNRWVAQTYSAWTQDDQKQLIALFEKFAKRYRDAGPSAIS